MKRYILFILVAGISLALADRASAASMPDGVFAVRNDTKQQPDPKTPKVVTARVAHSAENEIATLYASFPEDAVGVRVSMYNILGKLIEVQNVGSVNEGDVTFQFLTKGLPNGPYLIVLESGTQRLTSKVMVSR